MVGLISNNNDSAYKAEVQHLAAWIANNNLALNQTKELIVDFRKPLRFCLGPSILHPSSLNLIPGQEAHQCVFLLRRVKKVHLSPQVLVNFYH